MEDCFTSEVAVLFPTSASAEEDISPCADFLYPRCLTQRLADLQSFMKNPIIRLYALTLCLLAILLGCTPQPPTEIAAADFVLTNGKVYTVDEDRPWAEAVAVRGEEIVYVGDDAGAKAFVGEGTQEVDLEGRLLLPGFVESHIHILLGGATTSGLRLGVTDSIDDVLNKLGKYAEDNPERETIFGASYNSRMFSDEGRNKAMLDAVVSDRPVILLDDTLHSAWVNSKALELAGVTAETPDPNGGSYTRDASGEATGPFAYGPRPERCFTRRHGRSRSGYRGRTERIWLYVGNGSG